MEKPTQLPPSNNKAIFHSLAKIFAQVANGEIDLESATVLINAAKAMQKSMEIEINLAKTKHLIGQTDANVRAIEITNPEA